MYNFPILLPQQQVEAWKAWTRLWELANDESRRMSGVLNDEEEFVEWCVQYLATKGFLPSGGGGALQALFFKQFRGFTFVHKCSNPNPV